MTDVLLPLSARFAQGKFHYIDSTGFTRGIYSGAIETTAYGGDRFGATLTTIVEGGPSAAAIARRAQLLTWLVSLKGKQNRIWLPDHAYRQRGSFASSELVTGSATGIDATRWTAANGASLSMVDNVMRITSGGSTAQPAADQNVVVMPNVAYCVRAFLCAGRGAGVPALFANDGAVQAGSNLPGDGLVSFGIVPSVSPLTVRIYAGGSGLQAGDFYEARYASVSRCALVDGGPNLLLHSDTPGGTSWTLTNVTAAANAAVGPDGFTDAESLTETTANAGHNITQAPAGVSSATGDYAYSIYAKTGNARNWCLLQMLEGTGGTAASCYFNTTTGAPGSGGATVGANWASPRTFVENCGNGWFRFTLVARKTSASTNITVAFFAANGDGVFSYTGTSATVALLTWRASLSQSSFPTRAIQTIGAAAVAAAPAGKAMWLKGLPVSSSGLLRAGDVVQVGTQLCMATTSLDSNEAGLGYLQVLPPLRVPPADNTPVITTNPMGRFSFVGQYPEWQNDPGVFSSTTVDLEEACDV